MMKLIEAKPSNTLTYKFITLKKNRLFLLLFVSIGLMHYSIHGQSNYRNDSKLSLEKIMDGNNFIGHQPENHRFLPNGNLLFDWKKNGDTLTRTYILDATKASSKPLTPEELATYPLDGFKWHDSRLFCVYINNGALFKWDLKTHKPILLYLTTQPIEAVFTVTNSDVVYFQQNNNIFKIGVQNSDLKVQQVTNFVDKLKDSNKKTSWLEQQQLDLFDYHKTAQRTKSNSINTFRLLPKPMLINDDVITNVSISKDEKKITFTQTTYGNPEYTQYMNYMDESGYAKSRMARPKVGDESTKYKLGVLEIEKDTVYYFDENKLTNINQIPSYYAHYKRTTYEHKGVIFHSVIFSKNGQNAIVEIKSLDNKHRWIAQLNFTSKSLETLIHQFDEAWIGGPGISGWKEESGNLGWLDDDSFYFQSEKTGYSHLYTYSISKKMETALTSGNFEVHKAHLSNDNKKIYLTANKTHPGNRGFYHLDWASKKLTPVFEKDGYYDVIVSPQETHLCYLYSYKNKPWELYGCENSTQPKSIVQLTKSTTKEFGDYEFRSPEIVEIKAQDGKIIYARLYTPDKTKKNGAAVLFVHGAGYLQNAHNYWSTYHREYMFHNFLADNGYTVLDMDYRGSEGYGRDWRTGIYRHMGGKDLSDHLDGRNFLITSQGIDSSRVGIYGGSYGGFITLMALFKHPGKFKCGAALRSVTDWAHYNHGYTSNILNTPEEDEEAFKISSPIYFAQNLKDRLLILHGILDDNVQYQDVVRLSQRLIELQKDNWELATYPIEPHGFKTTTSWIDEYKRIYILFEEELNPKK